MCEFTKKSISKNYEWFSEKLSDDFHFGSQSNNEETNTQGRYG